jgi:CHAD domain-containing protein
MDGSPETISDPPAPTPSPPQPRRLVLELALPPGQADRLPLVVRGQEERRAAPLRLTWYDTPDFGLAAEGLCLVQSLHARETVWRLERLVPEPGAVGSPGMLSTVLAEAAEPLALAAALPSPLAPVAGFEGHSRMLRTRDGVELTLICGTLGAAAPLHESAAQRCCRVLLAGPQASVAALAAWLAGPLNLLLPEASLAAEAMALAGGTAPVRRHAALELPADKPVGEAFAALVAQLAAVILREAPRAGPAEPEPAHQMRVAVRRLRSAIGLFARAVRCPELTACKTELRALARTLGPARDWDVFAGGIGRAVTASFADDRAVGLLMDAAERRRQESYAALRHYLDSAPFRRLLLALAVLAAARPWEDAGAEAEPAAPASRQAELAGGPLAGFAARALERRLRPLRAPGDDIEKLPAEALHGVRLHGKRLRYACEFFAPLFPGRGARRFIRRLTVLQERLGQMNDGAVAASLMAELEPVPGYAGGVVRGFVAAQAARRRSRAGRSWRKFHRLDPFWG